MLAGAAGALAGGRDPARQRCDAAHRSGRRTARRCSTRSSARTGPLGAALTLVGVPGIGKSRLVRELFHDLDRRPEMIRWREGRSPPYGDGGTFWALGEIVKAEAGMLDSHELGSRRRPSSPAAVAAVIDDRRGRVGGASPARSGRSGGRAPCSAIERAEAFAAWRRFIERLAERRPTVLVFEDLHWADDALLDFIEHLSPGPPTSRCSCCAPRGRSSSSDVQAGRRIPARRRSSRSSRSPSRRRASSSTHCSGARCCPRKRARRCSAAEGNPLYAEEFVRMLVDRRILVQQRANGSWSRRRRLPVPDSVLGIIAARLDAVPRGQGGDPGRSRGREGLLAGRGRHVAERGRWAVEEALRRLEQRQLIRRRHESSVAGDAEYVFEHALIRDVAYRTIVRPVVRRSTAGPPSGCPRSPVSVATAPTRSPITTSPRSKRRRRRGSERPSFGLRRRAPCRRRPSVRDRSIPTPLPPVCGAGAGAVRARRRTSPAPAARARQGARGRGRACRGRPRRSRGGAARGGRPLGAAEAESTSAWLLSLAGRPEQARDTDERALELVRDAAPSAEGAHPEQRGRPHRPRPRAPRRGAPPPRGGARRSPRSWACARSRRRRCSSLG